MSRRKTRTAKTESLLVIRRVQDRRLSKLVDDLTLLIEGHNRIFPESPIAGDDIVDILIVRRAYERAGWLPKFK
jgi:hypothetical protein